MKMRTICGLFAGLVFGAGAAHAAMHDARTQLAIQLMEATHFDRTIEQMADQMPQMMAKQFESYSTCPAASGVLQEMSQKIGEKVRATLMSQDMKVDVASVYAEVFSDEELHEIVAFYQSPLGRKMVDRMPELMQKSMQISQDRMKEVMPDLQKIGEEYGERIRTASETCSASSAKQDAAGKP